MSESHIKTEKACCTAKPMWLRLLPGFVLAGVLTTASGKCPGLSTSGWAH